MTSAIMTQPQKKTFSLKKWALVGGLTLIVALAVGAFTWYYTNSQIDLPPVVSLEEFEQISGIRPKMIVVTADGGIVDFRFKVINPVRTKLVMTDGQLFPRLIVNDTGVILNPGVNHLNEYKADAGYFLFYPNVGSIVQTGTELSVLVGAKRYGPIVAK
jgi:hypothetical protein